MAQYDTDLDFLLRPEIVFHVLIRSGHGRWGDFVDTSS